MQVSIKLDATTVTPTKSNKIIMSRTQWNMKRNWPLHVMLVPAALILFIFHYVPMAGLVMAFQEYKPWLGFSKSPWVGLQHFEDLFRFKESLQVIGNTLIIATSKIVFHLIVPYIFALLLNEVRVTFFKRTVQTLVYLPHFLSWVILGGIFLDVLSMDGGIVNHFLGLFGAGPIFFLGNGDWFRITIVATDVWKDFGFATIIFLAALSGINPESYEAAVIDGANRWQQTVSITMPSLVPIAIVVGTLSLGGILNAGFDQIFNLYNPLVYSKGDIIDTYVYRIALLGGSFSFGTAVGMFKSVISFVLIVISYRLAYKFANYRIF
jgi:putative aldouronate transport system permease protein